ncbi:hypothetical protein BKD09_27145 [Bradyrhizobium japonicum]|uniref:Uncharacterized protein n=1 Tax=Bradyrhizobium japonicum TaxID=375 RepID=A0A1L3FFE3_BRAJP|nr:hypothetical protein [Bradyrhizobium japonicum]APG12018.1 hypothetical protein BKD09_27145 [Bradyrhizobium japonicum]
MKPTSKPDLDTVLDEFASLSGPPDVATLRFFVNHYPEFERELIEFATHWIATDALRSKQPITAETVDSIVNRTMSRVQAIMDAEERPKKLVDLAADIRAAGYDFQSFQRTVNIDRSILDCLIDRLVNPPTLPARLVEAVSDALKRTADDFRDYVRLPPALASANKSRGRPRAVQVDFSMLVRDSDLPDTDKTRWLGEAPDPKLAA